MSTWGTTCIFQGVHSREQLQPCTGERPEVFPTLLHRSQRVSAAGAGLCHSGAVPFQVHAIPGLRHASWQHRGLGTDTQQLPPAPSSASCRLVGWETSPLPHRVEIRPGIHSSFGQGEEVGRRENAESVLREQGQRVPELPGSRDETSPCGELPLPGSGQSGCWALWGAGARQLRWTRTLLPGWKRFPNPTCAVGLRSRLGKTAGL